MINPVELIGRARRRIALVAALRVALGAIPPALAALVLGFAVEWAAELVWARWGYVLAASLASGMRAGLWAGGVAGLSLAAFLAWRAYRKSPDFVQAAGRIDRLIDGKQEILTFASLADPALGEAQKRARTPLFPILWRRSVERLARFDPDRAFKLELQKPLAHSSLLTLALATLLGLSMLALVRPPSALEAQARRLRAAANELTRTDSSAPARSLAERLRAAAAALESPQLKPERKLEMLTALEHELEPKEAPGRREKESTTAATAGGESGKGEGTGKGEGAGKGESAKGEGTGPGKGGKEPERGEKKKSEQEQIAEIRKELANAKATIESSEPSADKSRTTPGEEKQAGKAPAPKPGQDAKRQGGQKEGGGPPELAGSKRQGPQTKEQAKAGDQSQGNKPGRDTGPSTGDTRLGQFPEPMRYERFYKLGEHGPAVEIKNARYVLFRIPPAETSAGGGKTVPDTERPVASTPYANVPLKEERIAGTPEERQLVPPRYRDLIR